MKALLPFSCILLLLNGLQSCNSSQDDSYVIILGSKASRIEKLVAEDLKEDLGKTTGATVSIVEESAKLPQEGVYYAIGTPASSSYIARLADEGLITWSPNSEGTSEGIWGKLTVDGNDVVVLAGLNLAGAQNALYSYCHEVLGVDPFSYWTGSQPASGDNIDPLHFQDQKISPPAVPILCYFENDVDELANLKAPLLEYDWESYTEMINALVRVGYNAIHLFDMLGRPEFFMRPEYQALRPGYDIRLDYIDSMINYAHDKGMLVQIDMALGYKIKPLEETKANCWKEYKNDWIETWQYYFEKTPLGKADIFVLRPRHQVWDWEYESSCGENKIEVFNEVYKEFGEIVDHYKPGAKKVVICYADAMEMFNEGFSPPKDFIIAWSDDGWGGFKYLPDSTRGYKFGTYMHAGFWLNHTVHDPYPEKIDSVMTMMFDRYGADQYCMVNGQQFRPFLLNLEAFSRIARAPATFDGKRFYHEWTKRYFGDSLAAIAVEAMQLLHATQFDNKGYVEHLWEIKEAIAYLSDLPLERPGKTPIPSSYESVANDIQPTQRRMALIEQALGKGEEGFAMSSASVFYHDYVYLPIVLYHDLIRFESTLHQMALLKKEFEQTGIDSLIDQAKNHLQNARATLKLVYEHRLEGDKNPKWESWYHPEKRRPNNGFPTPEMLDILEKNMTTWKQKR